MYIIKSGGDFNPKTHKLTPTNGPKWLKNKNRLWNPRKSETVTWIVPKASK